MDNSRYYFNRISIPKSIEFVEPILDTISPDVEEKDKALLDLIFTRNKQTGIPEGDLALYTNDKANPEVRRFIEMNLMTPVNSSDGLDLSTEQVNHLRSSISDDDIARFTRSRDESKEEYAERIRHWFDDERERRFKDKQKKQFEDDYRKAKEAKERFLAGES